MFCPIAVSLKGNTKESFQFDCDEISYSLVEKTLQDNRIDRFEFLSSLELRQRPLTSFTRADYSLFAIAQHSPQTMSNVHNVTYGKILNESLFTSVDSFLTIIALCSLKMSIKSSRILKWNAGVRICFGQKKN